MDVIGDPVAGTDAARATEPANRERASLAPDSVSSLADIVRESAAIGRRLRVVGRGHWLDAGRPVRDAEPVSVAALSGIVEYTPGDLTLTARAGTPLFEIDAATRGEGQWLTLSPWGGDDGSLGATVATATGGPLGGAFGAPRDIVLGIEVVAGTGEVVRGGGRVVKNVAGFDLTRLMVGAWGTLGIVTEVSVRLRALPERDETIAAAVPDDRESAARLLSRVREASVAPIALELVSASLASRIAGTDHSLLLARIAGNAESVAAQRAVFADMTDIADLGPDVWLRLRTSEPDGATVVRFSHRLARFSDTWEAAERFARGGYAHGSVLRGVARAVSPPSAAEAVREAHRRAAFDGTCVFERLPASLWSELAPSAAETRLARGVRAAFDPRLLLNPGLLGERSS